MPRYLSVLLITLVVAGNTSSAHQGERVCTPEQWEAVVVGKVAEQSQGKFYIIDVVGKAAADYGRGVIGLSESVFSQGQYIGSYLYLNTKVR